MNSANVKVVMFSTTIEEKDCRPTRVVMWKKTEGNQFELAKPYVTHYEITREDGLRFFAVGHYDMTLEEAKKDFDSRCEGIHAQFASFGRDYRNES